MERNITSMNTNSQGQSISPYCACAYARECTDYVTSTVTRDDGKNSEPNSKEHRFCSLCSSESISDWMKPILWSKHKTMLFKSVFCVNLSCRIMLWTVLCEKALSEQWGAPHYPIPLKSVTRQPKESDPNSFCDATKAGVEHGGKKLPDTLLLLQTSHPPIIIKLIIKPPSINH